MLYLNPIASQNVLAASKPAQKTMRPGAYVVAASIGNGGQHVRNKSRDEQGLGRNKNTMSTEFGTKTISPSPRRSIANNYGRSGRQTHSQVFDGARPNLKFNMVQNMASFTIDREVKQRYSHNQNLASMPVEMHKFVKMKNSYLT